jgi:transcriptional regulator with XRE-family HTH domain
MKKRGRRRPMQGLSYLRTYRRNWGLTQEELASLIGIVSPIQISRYENGKRDLSIEVALACQVIFGVPPSILFRDSYALVEEEVIRNIYRNDQALENSTNISDLRKRELFSMALQRAICRPHKHQAA